MEKNTANLNDQLQQKAKEFSFCSLAMDEGTDCKYLSLSLLVVHGFDDDTAQRVSLCRRMWLFSPKAETQTRLHTVQADPCWFLLARFATATSICCCSKVASPLSQTARHSSRSPAKSSSLSKGIPHLHKDDLM